MSAATGGRARPGVRLVMGREMRARLHSKFMVGSTVVVLVVILALAILPALLDGEDVHRVGAVGLGSEASAEQLRATGEQLHATDERLRRRERDLAALATLHGTVVQ